MTPLTVAGVASEWTVTALVYILGSGLFACVTALGIAFVYRAYSHRSVPSGVAIVLGLSLVTIWLNVESLLNQALVEVTPLIHYATAAYLLGVFALSAVTAEGGRRLGDYIACDVYGIERFHGTGEIASLVRSAENSISIELPETVGDIDGYPVVAERTKRALSGTSMLFPYRLSIAQLGERISHRIECDYDVGCVHVEQSDEGEITALAVGRTPSGIGPSLPPNAVAVAIRGDPSPESSMNDPIEVWITGDQRPRLVTTGTFRSAVGDVVTITVDRTDVDALDRDETYRIVTRPETPDSATELRSALRVADETVTKWTVTDGGPLHGEFVGWLPVTVLVIERDTDLLSFPNDRQTLRIDDVVYVLGTPEELHQRGSTNGIRSRESTSNADTPLDSSHFESASAGY